MFLLVTVLITVALAGFGRAVAEVGAVIIVGGNIDHLTRVMTTAIALETSKGNLALALALGIILLLIALAINASVYSLRNNSQRLAYLWKHGDDKYQRAVRSAGIEFLGVGSELNW